MPSPPADVRDDQGVLTVKAKIYKPSYVPPDESAEEMPQEIVPTILLEDQDGDGIYEGLYDNFSEEGEYRLVIYATDIESLQGEPVSLTVQVGSRENKLYLPLLLTQ